MVEIKHDAPTPCAVRCLSKSIRQVCACACIGSASFSTLPWTCVVYCIFRTPAGDLHVMADSRCARRGLANNALAGTLPPTWAGMTSITTLYAPHLAHPSGAWGGTERRRGRAMRRSAALLLMMRCAVHKLKKVATTLLRLQCVRTPVTIVAGDVARQSTPSAAPEILDAVLQAARKQLPTARHGAHGVGRAALLNQPVSMLLHQVHSAVRHHGSIPLFDLLAEFYEM
jgi:hypothetical protein